MRRPAAAVGGLVCLVALVLFAEGTALASAWLPVEEAAAIERARGGGTAESAGSVLYPLVLAPVARTLSASAAYEVARALSALLWAAMAVPAFLLARRLVPIRPALAVAGLAAIVPGSVYATAAVPDALAVLLAVSSLPLLARASERGSGRELLGALALAGAAALTRPWFVVLLPALLVAYELPRRSPRSFLRWPRSLAFAGLAGVAYLLLVELAPEVGAGFSMPRAAARAAAASLAVAAVGLGVLPWLLALPAVKRARTQPEAALLTASLPALVLAAGVFGTERGLDERPLLVLVPLVLALAADAWRRGAFRLGVTASLAAVVVLAAVALPTLGRAPVARAAGLGLVAPDGGSRGLLVAAVATAAVTAVLMLTVLRRRGLILPAALAVVLLFGQVSAWSSVRGEARALAAAEPAPRGWVDRHAAGARVLVVGPSDALSERLLAQLTLWNRTVDGARALDFGAADPATGWLSGSPEDSNLVLVLGTEAELAGTEVARSPAGVLLSTPLPLRLPETTEGVFPDGWSGEQAVYRRFAGPPRMGSVLLSVSRAGARAAGPAEVTIEAGPLEGDLEARARLLLGPQDERELEIEVPPPPFRVVVTIAPTIAAADGRLLGARLWFTYRPTR
ncbi:MAG: glycosyltransferase family 39 protein [Gaiellaceae bacterium]